MLTETRGLSENTWYRFGHRNRVPETPIFKTLQSAKVREGSAKRNAKANLETGVCFAKVSSPRRLREGKREARNMHAKSSQSAKVREGSAKRNAKVFLSMLFAFLLRFWIKHKGITMSTFYACIPSQQPASCLSYQSCDQCLSLETAVMDCKNGLPSYAKQKSWLREAVFDILEPQPGRRSNVSQCRAPGAPVALSQVGYQTSGHAARMDIMAQGTHGLCNVSAC